MPTPPELIDDVVGEIFLRVPPDDPALLLRASLVCKRWRRLLTSAAFLRRYRAFHGTPPLLGFLRNPNKQSTSCFVPTASFRPRDPERRHGRVLDCRHGRALLYVNCREYLVWDPRTGAERYVRNADVPRDYFNAAVMCAAGASCGHRDCHGGHFRIAFVGTDHLERVTYSCVYSSESGEWSAPTTLQFEHCVEMVPPVLAGGAMYFMCEFGVAILRYDLQGEGTLSGFHAPEEDMLHEFDDTALIPAGDCGLMYAGLSGYSLHLWSLENMGADGVAGWSPMRVFELGALLPTAVRRNCTSLIGTAPAGPDESGTIFVGTDVGVFAIGLEPRWIRKVCEGPSHHHVIFPYLSFFTPDHVFGGQPNDLE